MTVTVRTVSLEVIFAGNDLTAAAGFPAAPDGTETGVVLSARGEVAADSGWPTCSVFVTHKPETGNEEDDLEVTAGAGNNVVRFTGRVRRFRSSGFPRGIEMVAMGTLAYAAEWAPSEDIEFEEVFPTGATDEDLVQWALDQVPEVTYTSADIAGTGITLGTEAPEVFNWRAGVSAWSYIQQLDRATLYRTYQARDGTIRRVRMIGHPDETVAFTLDEGDILDGATGSRDTERTRNNVRVVGHDYSEGFGPASGTAVAEAIPGVPDRWEEFSSDLIENGIDETEDEVASGGLDARDIAAQIIFDVNKEFVEASIPSWRDDTHGPGQTCQLDMLDRLAIGEPMWVARHAWEVGDNGWQVTYGLTGGGLEQDYVPPPV